MKENAEPELAVPVALERGLQNMSGDSLLTALAIMSDGATLADKSGVIRYANPAHERLFGYRPGELVGQHVAVQHACSAGESERIVRSALSELESNGAWSGEWVSRRRDGSVFISSVVMRSVEWRGRPHWLCLQQALSSDNEERLTIAAEAAELGIWEWDIRTNTFIYSPRARAICGLPRIGDVTYDDVVKVTHPEDYPWTSAQARRALDPSIRDRTPYEYRVVRPSGETRWVRAYGYAVFAEIDGVVCPLRYVGTLEDITHRIADQRASEEAARQVRLAMEAARAAVWSLDLQKRTLQPSPEFNQLFGFPPEARPTLEEVEARYAPGVIDDLQARWQAALDRHDPTFEIDYPIRRSDGERWLSVRCEVSYDQGGAPTRAVGVVMDVTEQRQAKDAVRESDARFREAADSAPAPVWMTNRAGKMEFGNRALLAFAGLAEEEALGDTWLSLIHPDDLAGVIESRRRAWADGHAPYTFEARFQRADGQWRWLEVNSRARRDATGEFRGYVGLAVDRTEARHALATLAESEERFRLLADSAPVMIWMSDPAGGCLYLNAALRAFWGVEIDEVGTFDWRITMHPDDESRITSSVTDATRSARAFTVEGRYRNAQGKYRVIRTEGVPRFSRHGEFLGMIGVNADLTDLLEAQKHQQVLLEEMNHRVKNTLAVVQSLAKQTFRPDAPIDTARSVFDGRLTVLARAHALLTRSNWENARLSQVVEEATLICGEARKRIIASGVDVLLAPKQALTIALALHELATNAVKHGALSDSGHGEVLLGWSRNSRKELELEWRERGGPPVVPSGRRGFGASLLERILPRDVQGDAALKFAPEGVTYFLKFPLRSEA